MSHLAPIADAVLARFNRWKGKTLSFGGGVCMVNSVIFWALVHSMMVYRSPRSLISKMEVAAISWARVCAPT